MASGDASPADGGKPVDPLDVHRTYNRILGFQEARLAREALQEKRALVLTRCFLRQRERDEEEKLQSDAGRCSQEYSQRCRSLDIGDRQKSIAKEERDQILDTMRDRGQRRDEEAARVEAELRERQQWAQARHAYEKMEAQRRHQLKEEILAGKRDDVQRRIDAREERLKAQQNEKHQAELEKDKVRQLEKQRALAVRKRALANGQRSTVIRDRRISQKLFDADQRRREKQESIARANREASLRRDQILAETRLKAELHTKEASDKLQAKLRQSAAFVEARERQWLFNQQVGDVSPHLLRREEMQRQRDDEAWKRFQEKQGHKQPVRTSCWSQDVADATARAGKEYVQRRADLEQVSVHMHATKNFKMLADVARASEVEPSGSGATAGVQEDRRTSRMRSVHKMFIAKSVREAATSAASSSFAGTGRLTARARAQDQLCALCGREFPPQNLEGRFFSKVVERFRQQQSDHLDASRCPSPGNSSVDDNIQERVAQYDHEVRLCGRCTCKMKNHLI